MGSLQMQIKSTCFILYLKVPSLCLSEFSIIFQLYIILNSLDGLYNFRIVLNLQKMGMIKSITHSYSWNQYLFWYIERKDIPKIEWVLDNKPEIINKPLTVNYKTTPLHRAAVNGSLQVCKVLVQKYNADVNYATEAGQTPLMGAAKRDKIEIVKYLLTMGANTQLVSSNGLIAVQYAILSGFYQTALVIFQKMKTKQLKHPLDYQELGNKFLYRYVNYKVFVQNLLLQIEPENVPDFLHKPKRVYNDPVVDPRQTWKQWFLRQMEFKDPPLCERSQLPEELQPQNRRFGKIKHYLSRMAMSRLSQKPDFQPKNLTEIDSRDKLTIMKEMGVKSQKLEYETQSAHQSI